MTEELAFVEGEEDVQTLITIIDPSTTKIISFDYKAHKKLEAKIYVLSTEEGGRKTPFLSNYKPQFFIRTADITGTIILPKDVPMVMPGDNVVVTVEFISPIALEEGIHFAIREGRITVGAGVVSKILD